MKKSKGEYSIQTVKNAVRVLEAFRDDEELGVTQISRRLGLHKNNVFRLLATLEEVGYIEQCPSDLYRLGTRVLELGLCFGRNELLHRARPLVTELAEAVQETAHLAVLHELEVVHTIGHETRRAVMTGLRTGMRRPAHATALGKVLLGGASEEMRREYARVVGNGETLPARTDRTIVDVAKLFEQLSSVAVSGIGFDLGECEEGLCCAAAPVFDASGRVVAALSVSAPMLRWTEARLHSELAPRVREVGERLSRQLGYDA